MSNSRDLVYAARSTITGKDVTKLYDHPTYPKAFVTRRNKREPGSYGVVTYKLVEEATEEELKRRLEYLERRDRKLTALEAAGVDNWQGWDDAMDILREEGEDEE